MALTLLYLGSLFALLDEYIENMVRSVAPIRRGDPRGLELNVYLGAVPVEYPAVEMAELVCANSSRRLKPTNEYKPRAWRCLNFKQMAGKSLAKMVDNEGHPTSTSTFYTP